MPTYAYACTQCDNRFDVHQAFTDAALTQCPECTGRLRKVFGSVGVVFKGPGFYRTDSRESGKGGARTPAAKDKGSESSSPSAKEPAAASTSTSSAPAASTSSTTASGSSSTSSSGSSTPSTS